MLQRCGKFAGFIRFTQGQGKTTKDEEFCGEGTVSKQPIGGWQVFVAKQCFDKLLGPWQKWSMWHLSCVPAVRVFVIHE